MLMIVKRNLKIFRIQDVLFECAVLLENTKPKNKTESQAVSSNAKIQASKKLPKLELPHFYGDMENWISFKELFQATVEFTPHFSSKTLNLNALVVNKVTSPLPNFDIQIQRWPHLDNLILADPNFYISQQIDILLGADIYALLLEGLPIFGPSGTPAAISTKLGYILTGKIYTSQRPDSIVHSTLCDQSIEKIPPNVDDLFARVDTEEEAKATITKIQNLMKSGRFSLQKWSSSHKIILKDLDKSLLATESIHSLCDEEVKQRVLGIFWNLLTDSIQVRIADGEIVNTKRQLLSVIAKTFDPLGLFSPSVIILKIMLQELWKSKAAWDDPVPLTILETWTKFKQQSYNLNLISVPRFLGVDNNSVIHYTRFLRCIYKSIRCAVVYLKSRQNQVSLVSAKTRVAPIKQLTIPRLELCGSLLFAELITAIEKALSFPIKERYLWTDSTIVLSWINRPPKACIIQDLSTTFQDPADLRAPTPGHFLIGEPLLELPEGTSLTNQILVCSCDGKVSYS
ncbi:hypothetical protein HNY73_000391 [Argiope bruennichi]|uniref:Peptidase aspartic putative domain-containing protein n=1 Tax=Argiope bruennichi TaxID=94029 RepID=A0A8T0G0K0_ARGBR|nr:hypothetical protein HNY73_000391 [Argiope bruennichi]